MVAELAQGIGTIIAALSGLLTATGGVLVLMRKREKEDDDADWKELVALREELARLRGVNRNIRQAGVDAEQHIYRLELALARAGRPLPERPASVRDSGRLPKQPRN